MATPAASERCSHYNHKYKEILVKMHELDEKIAVSHVNPFNVVVSIPHSS